MTALKNFTPYNVDQETKERVEPEKGEEGVKEAALAIIGCKLLKDDHTIIIKDLFKMMDVEGDGSLKEKELLQGFNQILDEKHTE